MECENSIFVAIRKCDVFCCERDTEISNLACVAISLYSGRGIFFARKMFLRFSVGFEREWGERLGRAMAAQDADPCSITMIPGMRCD
jgi:hypothetical protein